MGVKTVEKVKWRKQKREHQTVCIQRHGGWANLIETWRGQRVMPVVSARRTCRQQGLLE